MKKTLFVLLAVVFGLFLSTFNIATASTVQLYVDAAPNTFGSPDYASWWSDAKADVATGTFTNMRSGINPANVGTTNFEIEDEVVYSFGDLGKRLSWIYWIPGETTTTLAGNFQIKLENSWDGVYEDFYDYYYGTSWVTPTKWENYDIDNDGDTDGVIGLAGMAWWGAYGVNTPEALASDIAEWGKVAETWTFTADLNGSLTSITSVRNPIPEPTTLVLLGFGLLGIAGVNRKKK